MPTRAEEAYAEETMRLRTQMQSQNVPVPLAEAVFSTRGDGLAFSHRMDEVRAVWEEIRALKANIFLEIGSREGCSLRLFASALEPKALLVSVDEAMNRQYRMRLDNSCEYLRALAFDVQQVFGDSHDWETQLQVLKLLTGRPVDVLHIDGDHRYLGTVQDWCMYAPLVRPGGLVIFHDINPKQKDSRVESGHFFRQLQARWDVQHTWSFVSGVRSYGYGWVRMYQEALQKETPKQETADGVSPSPGTSASTH